MSYVCAGRLAGTCKARHVHAERLDALAGEAVLARLVELRRELATGRPLHEPEAPREDHAAKIAAARRKVERLITAYADETITREELRARREKLDAEIGRLETAAAKAKRDAAAARKANRPEVRADVLVQVGVLADQWDRLPVASRRKVLTMLAERVEVVPAPRANTHEVMAPRIAWRSVAELMAER